MHDQTFMHDSMSTMMGHVCLSIRILLSLEIFSVSFWTSILLLIFPYWCGFIAFIMSKQQFRHIMPGHHFDMFYSPTTFQVGVQFHQIGILVSFGVIVLQSTIELHFLVVTTDSSPLRFCITFEYPVFVVQELCSNLDIVLRLGVFSSQQCKNLHLFHNK